MAVFFMAKTDCSRCEGLCCVALAFDHSGHFAFDKAAGVPCPHLAADNRCRIHADRAAHGFGGCIPYDCRGAGVRVVTAATRSWRDGGAAADAVFEAFRVQREVDEAREWLEAARALPLDPNDEERRAKLASELAPETLPTTGPQVGAFIRSLRRLPLLR